MFRRFVFISVLGLMLIALLASCGSPTQVDTPEADPGETVKEFYDWYLGDRSGPPKDARTSDMLSAELVNRIDEIMEAPVPTDMISFVCAQDFPEYVEVLTSQVKGEEAEVRVKTSFGNTIRLDLIVEDGEWRIDDVKCE